MSILFFAAIACFPTATSTDTDTGESAEDTSERSETGHTGEGGFAGTFDKYKTDSTASLRSVYSSGAGVYMVGTRGTAWVGTAESFAAYALPAELSGVDVNDIWGSGKEESLNLAVAADQGLVAFYVPGTWSVYNLGPRDNTAIAGNSLTNVYVVGDNGVHHFDGGIWSTLAVPGVALFDVCAHSTGAFVVGAEGLVLSCTSVGCTELDSGRSANLRGVACASSEDAWVVGDQGQTLHYTGSKFVSIGSDTSATLNAVFMDGDEAVAVGNTGTAILYNGDDWRPLNTDTEQNLLGAHGVSAKNVWAVGDGGVALQYKAN
ncbi:MAG: hypothetical protein EXR71_06005 [Myxococcales bacterium]|nr:hypothetical protein [Myxococcales bacterium]